MKNIIKNKPLLISLFVVGAVGIYFLNKKSSQNISKESKYSNFVGKEGVTTHKSSTQIKKLCQVRNSDGSTTMYSPNYNGKTPCWRGGTLTQSKNSVKHGISL